MARDWESWLATASGPASTTEEDERDRTEKRIRDAVVNSDIPASVRVYAKGSYANNTNVRRDADVDVAVEWTNTFVVHTWGKTRGMSAQQLGYKPATASMSPQRFREDIEKVMVSTFGNQAVDIRPDKHIEVQASSSTLDADVVPCQEMHRYDDIGLSVVGHRIYPKSGGHVDNYPKQNYDNGVAKNKATGRRYKEMVRCVKRLVAELYQDGRIRRDYPGYLLESMVYNVPNSEFGHERRYDDMQAILGYLWAGLKDEDTYNGWTEPSELLMLFRGRSDRSPRNAFQVIDTAWDRIGVA